MSLWVQIIASNLFVACLIGALAWCVGRSGRRSRLTHALWLVFFLKLITPPIVALPLEVPEPWWPSALADSDSYRWDRTSSSPVDGALAIDLPDSAAVKEVSGFRPDAEASRVHPALGIAEAVVAVWALGFVWIGLRGLIRLIRFHRLLQRCGIQDEQATAFVSHLVRSESRFHFNAERRGPQVLRLPLRVSPMLFGLGRRPVIVCPDQLWQSLSEKERQAFLAHETAHYCRRDHWVRWLEWLVTAVYWWFPGVYFARQQLERHEEACCDAWAVHKLDTTPRQYAEALLRVIDFISEYRVGIPRLASGMQPTYSLEERLHRVMKGRPSEGATRTVRWSMGLACFSLWLVHPVLQPHRQSALAAVESTPSNTLDRSASDLPTRFAALSEAVLAPADLPESPQGFWNRRPRRQWANFSLTLPGARITAEANRGIVFEIPGREPLQFHADELSAVVEIPSTQRIVIGDAAGRLRLWDLTAGMPVSLIGIHQGCVNSLAFHEAAGLISADESGSVIRWDLQSGQALATWAGAKAPVQSIRYAADGQTIAILTGQWRQSGDAQDVYFVDSRSLQTSRSTVAPPHTAVVLHSPDSQWLTVDWAGRVCSMTTGQTVTKVAKHQVSALVLSQESPLAPADLENLD